MWQPCAAATGWLTGFARQQLVQGDGQVAALRLGALVGDAFALKAELVVDAAPIANDAVGVEHEYLGRADRAELVGDHVADVLDEGKLDLVLTRVVSQSR